MPIDPSAQRKIQSIGDEITKLHQDHKDQIAASADQIKKQTDMLKAKKDQILNAQKQRASATNQKANANTSTAGGAHHDTGLSTGNVKEQIDLTQLVAEATGQGGFDYEKKVNDTLKKHGLADKHSKTAGSSADAPDAKFKHNKKEHNLEIKADHKAMFGQIELKHDGKKWDISDRSKEKYPHTAKSITDSGFLKKVNKHWGKPSGDYEKDLQMGNVYHTHHDAEPIKAHYGKDRKTDYIQIGGHGFYHTGNDAAGLGSPELNGKATLRARMKARSKDKNGKRKYGALVVMGLKDADKSHHDLDAKPQKEWIEDVLKGHTILESVLNPKDPHKDYEAKRKALHDLSLNKDVDQKAVQQRRLDLDKEYAKHTVKEAHKIGDKVTIHKGPADVVGKTGTVGEIRKGAFKGAEKTYTIDHEKGSIQLKSTHFKALKEDMIQLRKMLDKHSQLAIAANRNGDDEKVKHHQRMMNKVKDQMSKLVKEDLNEEAIPFVDAFWSGQQEEPKQNPYAEDTAEYAEYENGYMQGVMTRRRIQTESRGHKTLERFFKNRNAWSATGKEGTHRETGEKTKEYQEVDHEGKPTGNRHWRNEKGQHMGEETTPVAPAPHIHRIAVTVSDPDHPAVTKRDETQQKFVRITHHTDNKDDAIARGKKHFAKKGWKVHDAHHVGMVHESVDKQHPIHKEYESLKKHDIKTLRNMISQQHKIVDTSEFRSKDHAASHILRNRHGDKKVANVFGLKEEGEGAVPANNAGDGKIAGFAGDAGRKALLKKKPLQRKAITDFKKFVSQEHEDV